VPRPPAETLASKQPGATISAGGDELQFSPREMTPVNGHADFLSADAEDKVSRGATLALRQPAVGGRHGVARSSARNPEVCVKRLVRRSVG